MVPDRLFLTKGVGKHRDKLVSFELALRDAGIAQYNLVKVTSVFPPGCAIVSREEGLKHLSPGEIVFCVMAENSTDESGRLVAASIGLAVPEERDRHGYLLEHHSFDQGKEEAGNYAESMAVEMLATTTDRRDDVAKTTNVTQVATGAGNGLWTTVIVATVFISEGSS